MVQNTFLKSRWKSGPCGFCMAGTEKLEFHHTCYDPEKGLLLCHKCHNKVHFRAYYLTEFEKQKLANAPLRG